MDGVVQDMLPLWGIRDPFSMLSHLFGAALSLAGLYLLVRRARRSALRLVDVGLAALARQVADVHRFFAAHAGGPADEEEIARSEPGGAGEVRQGQLVLQERAVHAANFVSQVAAIEPDGPCAVFAAGTESK